FDDSARMWGDPEVTRYIGGRPSTEQQAWARFLRYPGHWTMLGYGYWVVVEKATGGFVGEVGFADFRREMTPSFHGVPEAGWALAPWAHGKGFATEAVTAALAWADEIILSSRSVCLIDPPHAVSIRVAEKCGYRSLGEGTYEGAPTLIFERKRPSHSERPI
ncbi:N-acetyltransferase, partial [bacterium]